MKAPCTIQAKQLIIAVEYALADYIRFSIVKLEKQWAVMEHIGGGRDYNIRLMDGSKAGGMFLTFEDAEAELDRIIQKFLAPLTRKEIVHHFTLAWMRKEEQADELFALRESLLNAEWQKAADIFNTKLSNYTREAIPSKVILQVSRNLK
jgi:predicted type IV restriction endonuclease